MGDSDKITDKKSKDTGSKSSTKPSRRRLVAEAAKETVEFVSPGHVLEDRYEVVEEIGRGGMGIVFKAHDRSLEMDVAIKVLPPELSSSKRAIRDLKREAKMAMQLTHPGIMALRHFADSGAVKFLVMELLEGQTLDDKLVEVEILEVDEVVELAKQIGSALDFAHESKVVHRDIKPANIFLKEKEDGYSVSLMDFGIARQIKDSMSRVSKCDSSGTLCYISPEQMRGKRADGRADVYSLAASLYECLAGHPPFYQGTISFQILNEAPAPIDDVPEVINNALLKALSKSPEERFQTAGDLAKALAGEEIAAPAPAPTEQAPDSDKEESDKAEAPSESPVETTDEPEDKAKASTSTEKQTINISQEFQRLIKQPAFKIVAAPLMVALLLTWGVFAAYSNSWIARLFGQPVLDNRPRPRAVRTALQKGIHKTAKNLAAHWRVIGEPSEKVALALLAGFKITISNNPFAKKTDVAAIAAAIYPPENEKRQQQQIEATAQAKLEAQAKAEERAKEEKAKAEASAKAKAEAERKAKAQAEADRKAKEKARKAAAKTKYSAKQKARDDAAQKREQIVYREWLKKNAEKRKKCEKVILPPTIVGNFFPQKLKPKAKKIYTDVTENPLFKNIVKKRNKKIVDKLIGDIDSQIELSHLKTTRKGKVEIFILALRDFYERHPKLLDIEMDFVLEAALNTVPVVGLVMLRALPAHPKRKSILDDLGTQALARQEAEVYKAIVAEKGRSVTPTDFEKEFRGSAGDAAEASYSGPVVCTIRTSIHKYSYDYVKKVTLQVTPKSNGASTSGTWEMDLDQKGKTKTVRPYILRIKIKPGIYRITLYLDGYTRKPLPIALNFKPIVYTMTLNAGKKEKTFDLGVNNMKRGR